MGPLPRAAALIAACWICRDATAQTRLYDSFTGPGQTVLENHSPDIGQANSWVQANGNSAELDTGMVRATSKNKGAHYRNETPMTNGTYAVHVEVLWNNNNPSNEVALFGRENAAGDGYLFQLGGDGQANLVLRHADGSSSTLQTTFIALPTGVGHSMTLLLTDQRKIGLLDGVVVVSSTNNALTAGSPGLSVGWFTASNGVFADDFTVDSTFVRDDGGYQLPDGGQIRTDGGLAHLDGGVGAGTTYEIGCGCRSDGGPTILGAIAAALALLGLRRARATG